MSNSSSPTIKKRSRKSKGGSTSASASPSRDGKEKDEEEQDNDSEDSAAAVREEAHSSAQAELKVALQHMPFQSGAVKVLSFGTLKPSLAAFHSPVSLYPVGYKCEVTVEHRESPFRPSSKEIVLCEILEVDDQPEFVLTLQTSGKVIIAPSEDAVWKKFEEKHSVDAYLSFSNLAIDLLLEGLPGATECQEYLFHVQRGYGTDYFTDEQAVLASTLFMPRQSRDSRSRHRQSARSLSAADNKVINEVRKKQKRIEDERKKAQIRKDKEAKEREKEAKERQRELDRAQKERDRAELAKKREEKKERDRLQKEKDRLARKEQARREGKASTSSGFAGRREKQAEMRKSRAEAAALVLQAFDDEEEQVQRDQMTLDIFSARLDDSQARGDSKESDKGSKIITETGPDIPDPLDNFLAGLTSFQEELAVEDDADIEQILDTFNCLYALRGFLGISSDLTFNKFIRDILGNLKAASLDENGCAIAAVEEAGHLTNEEDSRRSSRLVNSATPMPVQVQDAAELDRIQLNILRVLLPDLHSRFSLDEDLDAPAPKKDSSSKKGSKDKDTMSSGKTSFPLNQLTWAELARMLLLEFIDIEMEKSEEEIVHSLRGSKASGYKSSKNIMKNIRCRLAIRHLASTFHREDEFSTHELGSHLVAEDKEDKLLEFPLAVPPVSQSQEVVASSRQASENLFDFTTEAEVVSAVAEAALEEEVASGTKMETDEEEGSKADAEEYRRCCKVWLKIMAMSQAKALLWEVDENMYPGYFESMQKPLALVNVAYKLLQHSYPSYPTPDSDADGNKFGCIASCFYRDMRQVFVNCISYNSEASALYGHGQKLLQVLHRHMQQWVFSPSRPQQISQCDDSYCLHSHLLIAAGRERGEYSSIKCGRCAGVYALRSLQDLEQQQEFGVFQPTQEEVVQSHEDWICHLCLREDGVATDSKVATSVIEPFYIDEWGPTTRLPWHLNTKHILQLFQFTDDMPNLPDVVDAAKIVTAPNLTPMLPVDHVQSSYGDVKTGHKSLLPWTMRERLRVYAALCELLKSHEVSHEFMTNVYKESAKLIKMSVTDSFCEADFIEQVKRVAGTEGVALCRSLLDGVETDTEAVKQNKIVEGRCIHCRGSTFEDCVADDDEVLLCDGCNAEAHLSCLAIDKVPTREWYCGPCADRIASRVEGDETSLDIDSHRRTDLESALQEESAWLERERLPNPRPMETCAYCGGTELDLCSPLVYGQSREEFDESMKAFIGTLDLDQQQEEQIHAAPSIPFFPLVNDPKSSKMVLSTKKKETVVTCPVVHEICALKMCQARMQRSRHSIRRKRKLIADRVSDMSYISSRPLGHDRRGRFYWQFPNSNNSLFISPQSAMEEREPDKLALAEKMEAQKSGKKDKSRRTPQKKPKATLEQIGTNADPTDLFGPSSRAEEKAQGRSTMGKWLRITNILDIAKIIDLLSTSKSEAEKSLCHALRTLYHTDISKHHQDAQDREKAKKDNVEEVKEDSDVNLKIEEKEEEQDENKDAISAMESSLEEANSNAEVKAPEESSDETKENQFSAFSYEGVGDDKEDVNDDEDWDYGRRRPPRRAAAPVIPRAKPGEGIPVNMVLLPELGPEVLPEYVIKKEKVFEDTAGDNDSDDGASDDGEDDLAYQKYFMFSKSSKFFAVALQDCYNETCKLGKRFTVNFQIHYEDDDEPIACTMLREPWDDGVYYFATLNFKKSGNYTISFLAEGAKATNIAPLVFPVKVVADHVSLGAECALDSLRAFSFITHGDRHITHRRRELATELNRTTNEFTAVKSTLLAVYLALPLGALSMGFAEEDKLSKYDMAGAVVNATGWNSVIDQLWRESVLSATSHAALMECVLLLEFYINKNWLLYPHSKLLAALPSPHYAMRCVTCSAVALRVFCLDKAIAYDRVQDLVRPSKAGELERKEQAARGGRVVRKEVEKVRKSKSSQAAKRGLERLEATALVDEANMYGDSIGSSRPRRAAMTRARENMSQSLRQEYDGFDDEEEFSSGRNRRTRRGISGDQSYGGPKEWSCASCTYLNPPRARSCEACSERKPVEGAKPSLLKTSLAMSRAERMKKRKGMYEEEEDFEEEDEEESSSEDDDDGSSDGDKRKRKRGFYREVDSDEDEEDDVQSQSVKKKRSKKNSGDVTNGRDNGINEEYEPAVDLDSLSKSRREQLVDSVEALNEEERDKLLEGDLILQMLKILRELQDDTTSDPFWEPVDENYYTDYSDVVDEPMDLGSIARRVSVGFYAHPEEFAEDVRKVWSNCQLYNDESLEIHANSKNLGRRFEEMLERIISQKEATAVEQEGSMKAGQSVQKVGEDGMPSKELKQSTETVEEVEGGDVMKSEPQVPAMAPPSCDDSASSMMPLVKISEE